MKAAFLVRFASFVQWPADLPATGPFVIAVAGDDAVAEQLERLTPGMTVRGQPVLVRRVVRAGQIDDARVLYLGPGTGAKQRALRERAVTLPILLVTDRQDPFGDGAVINFVAAPRNVRFEVSLLAADRAHLSIDAALLAVAVRVERRAQRSRRCDSCPLVAQALP